MHLRVFILLCLLSGSYATAFAQRLFNPYETTKGERTTNAKLLHKYYRKIASGNKQMRMETVGPTDTDDSLQVLYYTADGDFNKQQWKRSGKLLILINNGIHAGEPDGINACMRLLWDINEGKVKVPDNIVLAVIPVFNISGSKSLRLHSRANQNGPEVTGFRANAQNLDLNRDFIKTDARETATLINLVLELDPDILIDNHVSNGADYQHVMTLLSTQHNKLGGPMGKYLDEQLEPLVYKDMKKRGYDLVPYVNVWKSSPDKGWEAFLELPRFLSGYAAMRNIYAFVAETHMLKPFEQRIDATYALMLSFIHTASEHARDIQVTRRQQREWLANTTNLAINWAADTTQPTMIEFKGYEASTRPSAISGQPRLYYDRSKPYTRKVPFYNTYRPTHVVNVPKAYIMPQGWHKVADKLKQNGVNMYKLEQDTLMELTVYYIASYETTPYPYEGHYLHSDVKVNTERRQIALKKGDYIIPTDQPAKRYLVETLEPTAPDAFFAWGFFDAVLQQKEYYSAYVFEDLAVEILNNDPALKERFEYRKKNDAAFAADGRAQLDFIYQHSDYHEPEHMRYPVYRSE